MNKKECCLNTLIFLVSCICLVSGIVSLLFGVAAFEITRTDAVFQPVVLQAVIGTSATVWIAAGAISIFIAIFGCCSMCCSSRGMFNAYAIILMLLGFADIYLGASFITSLGGITVEMMANVSHHDDWTGVFVAYIFGSAIFKLLGSIVGFVSACQFKPAYARFDQQPLVITTQNFYPSASNPPPEDTIRILSDCQ